MVFVMRLCVGLFFQAEDGIRDLVRSRGLGDVYKRQHSRRLAERYGQVRGRLHGELGVYLGRSRAAVLGLSLIHI